MDQSILIVVPDEIGRVNPAPKMPSRCRSGLAVKLTSTCTVSREMCSSANDATLLSLALFVRCWRRRHSERKRSGRGVVLRAVPCGGSPDTRHRITADDNSARLHFHDRSPELHGPLSLGVESDHSALSILSATRIKTVRKRPINSFTLTRADDTLTLKAASMLPCRFRTGTAIARIPNSSSSSLRA